MECFASNRICCLLSLSVNGTQLDRVVLISEECYKTWRWNLHGVELRTKGSKKYDIERAEIMREPSSALWNAENSSEG